MSILQEILAWTQGLPAWQSDAVARLLAKSALDAGDLDDLFALLKVAHGIPDSKERTAKALATAAPRFNRIPSLRLRRAKPRADCPASPV